MLPDAATNHRSWFGRGRERVDLDGLTLYLGTGDAVLAFPERDADLARAVVLAREQGAREIGCWSLRPDDALALRLAGVGFRDGWQPHWMGVDPTTGNGEPGPPEIEQTTACDPALPYSSAGHESVLGGDVHHFVVRDGTGLVGHAVLNVEGETGGIYDMGVVPRSRRRGNGRALVLGALTCARDLGCTSVTLNATGEGEPLYRSTGFESLGLGMTWWWFAAGC